MYCALAVWWFYSLGMLVFPVDDKLCLLGRSLTLAGLLEGHQGDGGSVCHDFSHSMSF